MAPGAGVEDGRAVDSGDRLASAVQSLDGVARTRALGVALGGQDDTDGGGVREGRRLRPAQVSIGHGEEELRGVDVQQRQHHLGLGVPEAHVVFDDLRAVRGQHEAGVEHAAVVDATAAQLLDQRADGRVHDGVHHRPVHVRHRRVSPHATGVRPGVAVADALEVLRRHQRDGVGAVAEHEERALLADQALLNDDGSSGVAERGARELGGDILASLVQGLRDQHALACRQSVRLDHPGSRQRLEVRHGGGGLEGVEGGEASRRNPRRVEHLLHEGLRALKERTVRPRSHDRATLASQRVGEAGHQRSFGADHIEVGGDLLDRLVVGHGDGRRHAGVARGHHYVCRACQHVGERVLAGAAADDADPHAVANETVCSRPGPTPTSRTGTPICSDRKAT